MSNKKLISVDRLKHYNDQLIENIITPNLANTLQEVSENFGHSLSISGTSLSLLDYDGKTLNTISLPQTASADWDDVTNKPSSFTPASHTHGDITNDGKIGSVSGKPIITTTGGKLSAGSFGTTAGTFCEGNDSRLTDARTPLAHTHSYAGSSSAGGAATSANKLNTDAGDSSTPVYFSNGVPVAVSTLSLNTSGQAGSVGHNVIVKLNSGTTEGTDKFTFNGSADKTIDITASSIGAVASDDSRLTNARTPVSHTHGNMSNDGKIGTESGKPIITTTGGAVTAGSFGTAAGTFCEGNDSRLSNARTPTSHAHGNITNEGKVGSTANLPVITGTGGVITTGSFGTAANTFCEGNDSRLSDARTPTSHTHGDITNDGKLGTAANKPLITTTSGKITTGSFGTSANTFCEGNDSRLSDARTPTSHVHGNITNAGAIGTTANVPIITGTNGVLQAGSFGTTANTFCEGNDSRLSNARTPTSHTHGNITNDGKLGTASRPVVTDANKNITTGSFGSTSGTFCEGNDSRLSDSRTPKSHAHGNITNGGAIGSTANLPLITGANGVVTTGSFGSSANTFCQGNDSRLSDARTPTAHTHGNADITAIDASKITSGTIDVGRLPKIAVNDFIDVADATARKALTTSSVQNGDTVRQLDTGVLYLVKDQTKLNSDDGYIQYTVNTPWTSITGKPPSYTPASHTHGNITNDGKLGTASRPVVTDANKNITTGSFGTTAGTFCEGNDSRLSDARTPTAHNQASSTINAMTSYSIATSSANISTSDSLNTAIGKLEYKVNNMSASGVGAASSSHTHGNITNDGKIGSTANLPLITSTSGTITTGSFGTSANTFCQGNDSRLSDARTPTDHASNKVTAMTGYSKASSASAISTSDSLNTAIGKLEKALDGKQASGSYAASDHTHSNYLTSSSTLDASKLSGTVPSGCYTNTTYSTFVKSGSTAASGLVPKPPTTAGTTKYLREDGSWETPPNDNTVYTHPTTAGNKHIPSGGSTGQILVYGGSSGTASWTTPSYAASSHSHVGTDVTLTGYSKASSVSAVAASDTVNVAIGKLEKAIDGKQASGTYLTSSSTLDASKLSGTVPSGCYTNTTYSAGSGISISGTVIKNTGIRTLTSPNKNGHILVNGSDLDIISNFIWVEP